MTYQMRVEFWQLGENEFFILTEHGQPVFRVAGTAFDWGTDLVLSDMNGTQLATISQTKEAMTPVYTIACRGKKFAEVRKEFSWSGKSLTLDVPGPNDYTIEGEFWKHEFRFVRQQKVVATVSKSLTESSETYGVRIVPGEDDVAILCTTIIIDEVLFDDDERKM